MIKKILSICASLVLAFVAVVTFGAYGKNLTAQAEEPEVPDTSTWEEFDVSVGDNLTGVWYRAYFPDTYSLSILTFSSDNYKTVYQGDYTDDTAPSEAKIYNVKLEVYQSEKIFLFQNSGNTGSANVSEIISYIITDDYVDFCIPANLEVDFGPKFCPGPQITISRSIILNSDAKISQIHCELLKRIEEPTTPDEPINPDDGTETPDDGTDEPKDATTDKVANWLNDTFGMNTNGNTVGAIAIILAGVLIIKSVLGKK